VRRLTLHRVLTSAKYVLCVLCVFVVQKREYVNEVNHVPEFPMYRGNADRARFISGGLPHGYVAEKTNPGLLAYGQEGTEKKSTLFREI
jgi:hypothetical protein